MLRFIGIVVLLAALVIPGLLAMQVVTVARSYESEPSDAIIVLGASQYWGRPSPIYANRLDHARDLWGQGVADRVITVGGKQPGDITTEAEAGKQYLVDAGIPADQVVAIPGGSDTLESMELAAEVMAESGWQSATIVSDRLHLARSQAIGEALGMQTYVSGRAFQDGSSFSAERVAHEVAGLLRFHLWDRWHLDAPQWQSQAE